MHQLKSYFPVPFAALLFSGSLYSLYQLWIDPAQLAWLGAAIAITPMAAFFAFILSGSSPRTRRYPPLPITAAVIGSVLVVFDFQMVAAAWAWGVGLCMTLLYLFWYAPMDRRHSKITIGLPLPKVQFVDIDGQVVTTTSQGKAQVWMFVRGNWCPLCVAQVKELAAQYQQLQEMGAEVMLISPQSADESRKLAARFDVPIRFLVDKDAAAAKALGIAHIAGVPVGLPGDFDSDTIMPTVVITNADGLVIFADQTDDYRVRPEPELFIQALKNA